MTEATIIIDNQMELELIEEQHPELKGVSLILLSNNFSIKKLDEFSDRGYHYFDELISSEDVYRLSNDIHHLLWNWFLDESGNDLSIIDGCSIGSAFSSSLEILFNSIFRYLCGLKKLLNENQIIYYSSETEDIFLDVIVYLQKEIGFKACKIESSDVSEATTMGKQKFDVGGRKRDLNTVFQNWNLKEKVASLILPFFQKKSEGKKSVLFMPAGKEEEYIKHVRQHGSSQNFCWILPITGIRDLFNQSKDSTLFYYFSPAGENTSNDIATLIKRLKDNLLNKVLVVAPELLVSIMERYTFTNFMGAMNYYSNAKNTFQKLRPELVIIAADAYENFILAAQAAKQIGVKTALIPHGLYSWGYAEYQSGRFKVFDYGFAYGQVDVDNYRLNGMPNEDIHIFPFPYLERFLPLKETNTSAYYKALVLSPDIVNVCPGEKIGEEMVFYHEISQLLEDLGIELIGIKSRHRIHFSMMGIEKNKLNLNGKNIPLFSGYTALPEIIKKADMIIGPASTAIIESNLLGKDYYVYQHTPFHNYTPSILPSLHEYANVSYDIVQLKKSILNKNPYKPGCSVMNLIDLKGVESKDDLFRKFESRVKAVLEMYGKDAFSIEKEVVAC